MIDGTRYGNSIGAALQSLAEKPSTANITNLANCYLEAAEYYAMTRTWNDCYECIKCAEMLSCNSDDMVGKVIAMCIKCRNVIENSEIVDALFDLVANVDLDGKPALRKQVFKAFHWFARFWDAYLDFCDWWGFENLEAVDFQIVDRRDSLAESVYIAYSRRLARITTAEFTFDFYIDFIDKMLAHNFTVYADYHIACFMIRVGFAADDVLRTFRKYIKQKHGKAWSWIMLSHLYEEDSVEHQACTLFAQECNGNLDDAPTIDYRAVCHNLFANVLDADATFWRSVQAQLRQMRDSGSWTERRKAKMLTKK